jgi:TonB family protein
MKTITILFAALLFTSTVFAQEEKKALEEIKVTPPRFTGIDKTAQIYQQDAFISFEEYLRENMKYPEEVLRNGAEGTEVVRFKVSANGKLTDFQVINSVSPEIDEAIYDMLKTTCGMWKPGENNGIPVSMEKKISIAFKWKEFESLNKTKNFDALALHYLEKGHKQLFGKDNPEKALRRYAHGLKYRPNEDCLLMASGICKYELGDTEGAKEDWKRMRFAGIDSSAEILVGKFMNMKGYSEVAEQIKE